jgi:hypothetical protein
MVSCRSTVSCNATGDDEIGMMSARECCMENRDGLSYIIPDQTGVQTCTICVGKPLDDSAACICMVNIVGYPVITLKLCIANNYNHCI